MTKQSIQVTRLSTSSPDFRQQLEECLQREMLVAAEITSAVSEILQQVKLHGDQAIIDYTNHFDGFDVQSISDLVITSEQLNKALERLPT